MRSKKALIIVIISVSVAVFLLIGCALATALFIYFNNNGSNLSEESLNVLEELDTDVIIYHIHSPETFDRDLHDILNEYKRTSRNISIESVDPTSDSAIIQKYTDATLSENSLIIEGQYRSICIDGENLYKYRLDMEGYNNTYISASEYEYMYQTYEIYYGTTVSATPYFFAENEITNAIVYVMNTELPVLYSLTGHGETSILSDSFSNLITDKKAEPRDLELMSDVPSDAVALIINVPTTDISREESDAVIEYLENGGNVILSTYVAYYSAKDMPNLAKVCSYMGLTAEENYVFESNTNGYSQYPYYLLPSVTGNGITASLSSSSLFTYMIESHSIKEAGDRNNVSCLPLLKTTDGAYFYTDAMEAYPENEDLIERAEKAVRYLAYQSTVIDNNGNANGTLYWFASPYFMNDSFATYGNGELFSAIISESCTTVNSVSIEGVPLK